jgi:hypothetical protein
VAHVVTKRIHVCSFSAVQMPKGKALTYESFREAVLAAGRFSVFEATETDRSASLYTALCRDPEIETDISCGYPWTIVRRRSLAD